MADKLLVTLRSPFAIVQSGQLRQLSVFVATIDDTMDRGEVRADIIVFRTSKVFVPGSAPERAGRTPGTVMASDGIGMTIAIKAPITNVSAMVPWPEEKKP